MFMSRPVPAAIGLRAHSGWAALVAVAGSPESPVVLDRRRIEIADRSIPASVQPYHAAQELGLGRAEKFLERCEDAARSLAQHALRKAIDSLDGGHQVVACGILLGSGRPALSLDATLASHAAIHTAEGELFRKVLVYASGQCNVPCRGVREKELFACAAAEFQMTTAKLQIRLAEIGKCLGPPWRQDQKYAALAGWLALRPGKV